MKKIVPILIIFLAISSFVFPPKAQAYWWNIFSWPKKENQKSNVVKIVAHSTTTPVNSSSSIVSSLSSSSANFSLLPKKEAVKQNTVVNINKETPTQQANDQSAKIEKLKKEMAELKNKADQLAKPQEVKKEEKKEVIETKKDEPKTTTLPNGAVVEMDASGNIVRTIKEAQTFISSSQATQTSSRSILTSKQVAALVSPSVVLISTPDGNGSGFVVNINRGKFIVTNAHVVKNASIVDVKLTDGTVFKGTVLGRDEFVDLALVSIDLSFGSNMLSPVSLGSSDTNSLATGDDVYTLGYPLSLSEGLVNITFTKGTLSARQKVNGYSGILLQTDAAINHGNSGGPLLNNYGEVIGVNTFGLKNANAQGIYFAIPVDTVKQLMTNLLGGLNKTKFEIPSMGSSVMIPRSIIVRIDMNPNLSCVDFGYVGNDLTQCGLYKNNYKDYQWIIIENQ